MTDRFSDVHKSMLIVYDGARLIRHSCCSEYWISWFLNIFTSVSRLVYTSTLTISTLEGLLKFSKLSHGLNVGVINPPLDEIETLRKSYYLVALSSENFLRSLLEKSASLLSRLSASFPIKSWDIVYSEPLMVIWGVSSFG